MIEAVPLFRKSGALANNIRKPALNAWGCPLLAEELRGLFVQGSLAGVRMVDLYPENGPL